MTGDLFSNFQAEFLSNTIESLEREGRSDHAPRWWTDTFGERSVEQVSKQADEKFGDDGRRLFWMTINKYEAEVRPLVETFHTSSKKLLGRSENFLEKLSGVMALQGESLPVEERVVVVGGNAQFAEMLKKLPEELRSSLQGSVSVDFGEMREALERTFGATGLRELFEQHTRDVFYPFMAQLFDGKADALEALRGQIGEERFANLYGTFVRWREGHEVTPEEAGKFTQAMEALGEAAPSPVSDRHWSGAPHLKSDYDHAIQQGNDALIQAARHTEAGDEVQRLVAMRGAASAYQHAGEIAIQACDELISNRMPFNAHELNGHIQTLNALGCQRLQQAADHLEQVLGRMEDVLVRGGADPALQAEANLVTRECRDVLEELRRQKMRMADDLLHRQPPIDAEEQMYAHGLRSQGYACEARALQIGWDLDPRAPEEKYRALGNCYFHGATEREQIIVYYQEVALHAREPAQVSQYYAIIEHLTPQAVADFTEAANLYRQAGRLDPHEARRMADEANRCEIHAHDLQQAQVQAYRKQALFYEQRADELRNQGLSNRVEQNEALMESARWEAKAALAYAAAGRTQSAIGHGPEAAIRDYEQSLHHHQQALNTLAQVNQTNQATILEQQAHLGRSKADVYHSLADLYESQTVLAASSSEAAELRLKATQCRYDALKEEQAVVEALIHRQRHLSQNITEFKHFYDMTDILDAYDTSTLGEMFLRPLMQRGRGWHEGKLEHLLRHYELQDERDVVLDKLAQAEMALKDATAAFRKEAHHLSDSEVERIKTLPVTASQAKDGWPFVLGRDLPLSSGEKEWKGYVVPIPGERGGSAEGTSGKPGSGWEEVERISDVFLQKFREANQRMERDLASTSVKVSAPPPPSFSGKLPRQVAASFVKWDEAFAQAPDHIQATALKQVRMYTETMEAAIPLLVAQEVKKAQMIDAAMPNRHMDVMRFLLTGDMPGNLQEYLMEHGDMTPELGENLTQFIRGIPASNLKYLNEFKIKVFERAMTGTYQKAEINVLESTQQATKQLHEFYLQSIKTGTELEVKKLDSVQAEIRAEISAKMSLIYMNKMALSTFFSGWGIGPAATALNGAAMQSLGRIPM
jgi:hypothetical protein